MSDLGGDPPGFVDGADDRIRTGDHVLTKDVLYLLSYVGTVGRPLMSANSKRETGFEPATIGLEGQCSTN